MGESKSHQATANRIADKLKTDYNNGKGVDIKTPEVTVEVETSQTAQGALSQMQGHRGPCYIAGTNQGAVQKAMKATEGTTVGVMDNQGNILKRPTRKN